MNKKLFLRKTHRYIGLLISIQLFLWTIGGIYFSWTNIDDIHGDHLKKTNQPNETKDLINHQQLLNKFNNIKSIDFLKLNYLASTPVYSLSYTSTSNESEDLIINAQSGKIITSIPQKWAEEIAQYNANFEANIKSTELLTKTSKHHEYREKPLPAWAITFDYSSTPTFYINAKTGQLVSVRHTSWRIFDFLWMLHTMDYEGRDDFGNWLLKIFSIIALITSLTGIILFIISSKKLKLS